MDERNDLPLNGTDEAGRRDTAKDSDPQFTALSHFKDWSNYLLVTTTAAIGWIASEFGRPPAPFGAIALLLLAGSVLFAILTLALIPHVAEHLKGRASIYDVKVSVKLIPRVRWTPRTRLKPLCWPQHILFLLGITTYALGAAFAPSMVSRSETSAASSPDERL